VTVLIRLFTAALAGGFLVEAGHVRDAGHESTAVTLAVFAAVLAGGTVLAVLVEAQMDRKARRDVTKWRTRAWSLRSANRTLRDSKAVWRRRAIYYQALYELAEAETQHAMLHTPMARTLVEVHQLPDTRDRAS